MGDNEYPIDTLSQMAAIPEEAMPRFLAELPHMLASIRRMKSIVAVANEVAGAEVLEMPPVSGATWTDDDKGEFTETVRVGSIAGEPAYTVTRRGKIGGYA